MAMHRFSVVGTCFANSREQIQILVIVAIDDFFVHKAVEIDEIADHAGGRSSTDPLTVTSTM